MPEIAYHQKDKSIVRYCRTGDGLSVRTVVGYSRRVMQRRGDGYWGEGLLAKKRHALQMARLWVLMERDRKALGLKPSQTVSQMPIWTAYQVQPVMKVTDVDGEWFDAFKRAFH